MICVGIDVAKDKHDCFIINSEGEVLADVFHEYRFISRKIVHFNLPLFFPLDCKYIVISNIKTVAIFCIFITIFHEFGILL